MGDPQAGSLREHFPVVGTGGIVLEYKVGKYSQFPAMVRCPSPGDMTCLVGGTGWSRRCLWVSLSRGQPEQAKFTVAQNAVNTCGECVRICVRCPLPRDLHSPRCAGPDLPCLVRMLQLGGYLLSLRAW